MPRSQLCWFVQFTAEHLTLSVVMESKCWMTQHLAAISDQMSDTHTTDIQLKLLMKKKTQNWNHDLKCQHVDAKIVFIQFIKNLYKNVFDPQEI